MSSPCRQPSSPYSHKQRNKWCEHRVPGKNLQYRIKQENNLAIKESKRKRKATTSRVRLHHFLSSFLLLPTRYPRFVFLLCRYHRLFDGVNYPVNTKSFMNPRDIHVPRGDWGRPTNGAFDSVPSLNRPWQSWSSLTSSSKISSMTCNGPLPLIKENSNTYSHDHKMAFNNAVDAIDIIYDDIT